MATLAFNSENFTLDAAAMRFVNIDTVDDATFQSAYALVYHDFSALSTYFNDLVEAEAVNDGVLAYTDGYAIIMQYNVASEIVTDATKMTGACVGGTYGEGDDAIAAASCWSIETTFADDAATGDSTVSSYYDATAAAESTTIGADDSTMELLVATDDSIGAGFEKFWQCTGGFASGDAAPTESHTYECGRFMVSYDSESEYHTADDLRFDDDVDGVLGYISKTVDGDVTSTTITWVEPGADTFTWKGAFQAATVAGAAALVALTF